MGSFNNKRVTFTIVGMVLIISVTIICSSVQPSSSVSAHLQRPANSAMLVPDPWFMLKNKYTNRLYITNYRFGTVSVVNSSTDSIDANISVETLPAGLGLNTILNRIYVTNYASSSVSVIDGGSNKVLDTIHNVGRLPSNIAIDTKKLGGVNSLIFVSSMSNITVINGLTNEILGRIPLSGEHVGMALDPFKKRLYVSNSDSNFISVIQYHYNFTEGGRITNITHLPNIEVTKSPGAIDLSPDKRLLYVTIPDNNSVSIVNTSGNHPKVLRTIPVGYYPWSIGVDDMTGKVYVANYNSSTISIIDKNNTSNRKNDIAVGQNPFHILVDPNSGLIYVNTLVSRSIDEIRISSNKLVAGVIFHTNPDDAGYIKCNEEYTKLYMRYEIGTNLSCDAQPNPGFRFSSWSGDRALTSHHETEQLPIWDQMMNFLLNSSISDFGPNTNPLIKFEVSQYGTLNANFVPYNPFSLPKELWVAIPGFITSFYIPSILRWLNDKRQRRNLREYMNKIDSQHNRLDEITVRNEIEELYTSGKITDSQYQILKDKVSQYYKDKS